MLAKELGDIMKAVEIIEPTQNGHRVLNYVYVINGSVKNKVVHLSSVNDDLERAISEGVFNPDPSVSKYVHAKREPELFIKSLQCRYNNYICRVVNIEEKEIKSA